MKNSIDHKIKLLVVDDNKLFRSIVVGFLKEDKNIKVVGECEDGDEVVPFLIENEVDIIIMDFNMQRMNGDCATIETLKFDPSAIIIGYSAHEGQIHGNRMISCGAKSYVNKETKLVELINTVKAVYFQHRSSGFQKSSLKKAM